MFDDVFAPLLAHLIQFFGESLGYTIVALSLCLRIALLPLTIALARRAWRNEEIARSLQPEIDVLKQRFAKQPERLWKEIRKLYRQYNYSPLDMRTLTGSLVQLPLFAMVYGAIRRMLAGHQAFPWIRNLAAGRRRTW